MKNVIVTGHTRGLGQAIYQHFLSKGYAVFGMSRSNGYDIETDVDKIISIASEMKCDYFFNNAHCGDMQKIYIKKLASSMMVITSGSMGATEYSIYKNENPYYIQKYNMELTHIEVKRNNPLPMLLLKMGYLENYPDRYPITYKEILAGIDFWINNTRVSILEYGNINIDEFIEKNR
jgi:hypothetical protein